MNQRTGLDGYYTWGDCQAGLNVRAYVVDTGVWGNHTEFQDGAGSSRVVAGWDYATGGPGQEQNPCNDYFWRQDNKYDASHGTAVASVLGGRTVGVAPAVTIVPVRAFDCQAQNWISNITAGLDWIMSDPNRAGKPSVVVASWGVKVGTHMYEVANEAHLTAIDTSVTTLIQNGITFVTSAENFNEPAINYSPNRIPEVLTVGATTRNGNSDQRWSKSNFGSVVDVWAPGAWMKVAHWPGQSDYRTEADYVSGTSFAAPLVAGIVARWLSLYPGETPEMIHNRIVNDATTSAHGNTILGLTAGDNNRMIYKDSGRCRTVQ